MQWLVYRTQIINKNEVLLPRVATCNGWCIAHRLLTRMKSRGWQSSDRRGMLYGTALCRDDSMCPIHTLREKMERDVAPW